MQNLKVYLTKSQKQRGGIQKIKLNLHKHKMAPLQAQAQKQRQKMHHNSQNNLLLSKSTDSRLQSNKNIAQSVPNPNNLHINFNTNIPSSANTNLHVHTHSHVQSKKKNGQIPNVNRSLQQLYDFRQEVRNIIYHKEHPRYGKQLKEGKDNKRKASKQVASDTKLYYRSQPHSDYSKIGIKGQNSSKNDKSLQNLIHKKKQDSGLSMYHQKTQLKIRNIQENKNTKNKMSIQSKQPAKKRSKSANPQKKLDVPKKQRERQKRSYSLKKVSKNHHDRSTESKHQNESQKQTINLLNPDQISLQEPQKQIILRSMFRTRKGIQIMNPNKVNQDRLFIKENVLMSNNKNISIYAVADGHGPYGHYVSHLIMDNLFKRFQNHIKHKNVEQTLEKIYTEMQSILAKNVDFNADFSGSTLVTIVIDENRNVTCANVGDSRAIVARQLNKSSWEVIRLSNDHKPNLEEEKNRILAQGGRIQTVYDEDGKSIGPLRVWLPKKQIQGLAMSRSLGDNISKPIGVTHEPQVLSHKLSKDDKFILLASDGVWQFLTNYQILSLIIPYYRQNRLEDACEALMKQAHKSWTIQDNSVVDDITFILIFLTFDGKIQKGQAVSLRREGSSEKVTKMQISPKMEVKETEQNFNDDSLEKIPTKIEEQEQKIDRNEEQ